MSVVTDTFSETALLSITKKGGSNVEYRAIIENFEITGGEKGFDSIAMISGARRKKFNPQEDIEVSIDAYTTEVGTNAGSSGKGFFNLIHSDESTTGQPISIPVDRERNEYQIVVLWTDDTSQTSATDAVTSGKKAKRIIMKNGHFTMNEESFTDKVSKCTITFKCPPFDSSGNANITYESTDGTAALSAVSAYS